MPGERPFSTFNFRVQLRLAEGSEASGANTSAGSDQAGTNEVNRSICNAEFSECTGLEMNMAPKTIREGGNNGRMIHLPGPVSYGQLGLKRGMTSDFDLWIWFERSLVERGLRASGSVTMLGSDREPTVRFELTGCLPIKLKAPGLQAKDGQIAIEEMQIAYETMNAVNLKRGNGA